MKTFLPKEQIWSWSKQCTAIKRVDRGKWGQWPPLIPTSCTKFSG